MLIFCRRTTSAAFGLSAVIGVRAHAQDRNPTLVGIVRADAVVLPFARFEKNAWSVFPASTTDSTLRMLSAVDLPETWSVHYADGTHARRAMGGSPVRFVDNAETEYDLWGQLIGIPSRRRALHSFPIDRVGLAVSGAALNARVTTFAERDQQSRVWRDNRATIERAFRRAADTLAREVKPLRLRSLYVAREGVDGAQLFYVDAIAVSGAPNASRECPPGVYYQAWLRRSAPDSTARVLADSVTAGADCDSPGAEPTRNVPFGVIHLSGRLFIPVEYLYYEGGKRQLFELTPRGLTPAHPEIPW